MKIYTVGDSDLAKAMWGGIEEHPDGHYIDGVFANAKNFKLKNKLVYWAKSHKFSGIINALLQMIVVGFYSLSKVNYDRDINYIILSDTRVVSYPREYFIYLAKKYNLRYVLVYLNPEVTATEDIKEFEKIAYKVFSYSKSDCEKNGYERIYQIYSYTQDDFKDTNKNIENDVFYWGSANDRIDILVDCYEKFKLNNLNVNMGIMLDKDTFSETRYNEEIVYNKKISYNDMLVYDSKANCILEVVNSRQDGITMRTMEAVALNKKLLTNNVRVKECPFYDDRYIKIFDTPDDIDTEWICQQTLVDYNYSGECLPMHLLERIM